jgi:hypothetical protein
MIKVSDSATKMLHYIAEHKTVTSTELRRAKLTTQHEFLHSRKELLVEKLIKRKQDHHPRAKRGRRADLWVVTKLGLDLVGMETPADYIEESSYNIPIKRQISFNEKSSIDTDLGSGFCVLLPELSNEPQELMDIKETKMFSPYIGKTYSRNEIISVLNENPNLVFTEYTDFNQLTEEVSRILSENRVIGWFQDGSEIGPRALGNRSILASPIKPWMTGHINGDIKIREWYRPFAPAVLFEHQKDVFESDVYSPYMLVTTTVKEEWRKRIPAVTHIDNSARHQSVTELSNPKFYNLIKSFYNKTGVPVLLNTSFNGPTEPIVETPKEAIATFLERNINFLVINNFLISRG